MKTDVLTAADLVCAMNGAFQSISANRNVVNRINVFPVADADTGTNLIFTFRRGVTWAMNTANAKLGELAAGLAARIHEDGQGNSGIIVGCFWKELLRVSPDCCFIDATQFRASIILGAQKARSVLSKPAEGTVLTVMDAMASVPEDGGSVVSLLQRLADAGRRALATTPSLLPLLARHGVVDAAGLGLVLLFEGMIQGLLGREVALEPEHRHPVVTIHTAPAADLRYCTEFRVESRSEDDLVALRNDLSSMGDSIGLVALPGSVKAHLHTNTPGPVFDRARRYGRIIKATADDMYLQAADLRHIVSVNENVETLLVAVAHGVGIGDMFVRAGAMTCLDPSPSSLGTRLERIREVLFMLSASTRLLVLAENRSCPEDISAIFAPVSDRVRELRVRNALCGLAAIYAYSPFASVDANLRLMGTPGAILVDLVLDTVPSTDGRPRWVVEVGGLAKTPTLSVLRAFEEALDTLDISAYTSFTVYEGLSCTEEVLEVVLAVLTAAAPAASITRHWGGQEVMLLVALE